MAMPKVTKSSAWMLMYFLFHQNIPHSVDAFITKQFTLGSYQTGHVLYRYRSVLVNRMRVIRSPIDIERNTGGRSERENHVEDPKLQMPVRSKQTSTFWFSDPEREPLTEDRVLPCEYNLDPNGPLPFGSYRTVGESCYDPKRLCLITSGITLRNVEKRNEIDTSLALANAHKMIDSGLTSFQVHIARRNNQINAPEGSVESGMESSSEQEWIEQNIYKKLIQETPSSVLSLCNLGTKISVPYWNYRGNIGKGSMVRQKIGDSILNIFGNAGGCLDSVHVEFRPRPTLDSASPYTFDVLDTLFDMKREGLIRSIHGIEFPASVLRELKQCNFYLDTNQVTCNLLNPNDYIGSMQQVCKEYEQEGRQLKLILKSPLAGGLLTNKYYGVPNKYRGQNGEPSTQYMTKSEKWAFEFALKNSWLQGYTDREHVRINKRDAWMSFEKTLLEVMYKIALKHRVDVASVAVRWNMQQDHLASVLVGTGLNMQYDSDYPFTRPRDLRRPFTFHLDEEDLERLWSVCGANPVRQEDVNEFDPTIDFSNRRLWL
jgi:diketogulonate reductase-like aldo/keto reductase